MRLANQSGSPMSGSFKQKLKPTKFFLISIIFHSFLLFIISLTPPIQNLLKEQVVSMDMLPSSSQIEVKSSAEEINQTEKLIKKTPSTEKNSEMPMALVNENNSVQPSRTNETKNHFSETTNDFSPIQADTKVQYISTIYRLIDQKKRYPRDARIHKHTGPVEVCFSVLSNGIIENIKISKPAPFDSLNEAALKAVQQVGRVASIPTELQTDRLDIVLTIQFNLN